jgi:hypothetical protein
VREKEGERTVERVVINQVCRVVPACAYRVFTTTSAPIGEERALPAHYASAADVGQPGAWSLRVHVLTQIASQAPWCLPQSFVRDSLTNAVLIRKQTPGTYIESGSDQWGTGSAWSAEVFYKVKAVVDPPEGKHVMKFTRFVPVRELVMSNTPCSSGGA